MKRSKDESKKIILEAAERLFTQRGIANVKVSDIAMESGIDACMINHHFGGKDGLIESVLSSALEKWQGIGMGNYYLTNKSLLETRNGQKVFIAGLVQRVFEILKMEDGQSPSICMLLQLLQYPGEIRTKLIDIYIKPLFGTFYEIYHKITGVEDYEDAFCWYLVLICPQYVNTASPGLLGMITPNGKLFPSFAYRLQFITTQILLSGLGLQ